MSILPLEADPVLLVDPDAVLACAIASQALEPVPGRDGEFLEVTGAVDLIQVPPSHRHEPRHVVEVTWRELFAENGAEYEFAILVLYRDAVESACGVAPAATGPFYCPADTSVYLDLSFYETLRDRYGAAGDFAEAYMIAHEIGHHVQRLTGTMDEVGRVQAADPSASNELSVLLELQADCYAGVWAAAADRRGIMEPGDLHERLQAAAAVGDDRLSQPAGRIPNLETFTHGSSEQRMGWFRTGYEAGVPAASDTFARE